MAIKPRIATMHQTHIEFSSEDGKIQRIPLISAFTLEDRYYMVVLIDDELVVLKVESKEGQEYVQVVTEKKEWDEVRIAWNAICDAVIEEDLKGGTV